MRVDASKGLVVRGHAEVKIQSAAADGKEDLYVFIKISSKDNDKVVNFAGFGYSPKRITLADNKGNNYLQTRIPTSLEETFKGAVFKKHGDSAGFGKGPAYFDRPRIEGIAFDRPVASAEYLDLTLPGEAIGSPDPILFRLPQSFLKDISS